MKNKKISYRKIIIIIVAIILLIVIGISITMARYRSQGEALANAYIAFFVVEEGFQTGNIMLSNLYPNEDPFEYTFTIANTDGEHTAQTSIDYTIEMCITTNLPLEIDIYKGNTKLTGNAVIENTIELDSSGQSYIRRIKIKNGSFTFNQTQTDTYKLSVTFPIKYADYEEYEGMIDNVAITVDAKQKI